MLHLISRTMVALMVTLTAGVLAGCSEQQSDKNKETLTLYGNIDIREVQLAFQDSGRLARLLVDEGSHVRKGQVVAELDAVRFQLEADRIAGEVQAQEQALARLRQGSRSQEIDRVRAGVASASASLKDAELQLSRKINLLQTNKISQQEIDSAKARVDTMQASLKASAAELSLALEGPRKEDINAAAASLEALRAGKAFADQRVSDARLSAPADGIIRNRVLEPGAMAAAGSPVLTLALTDPLWVRAYISEPDLGKVKEGMPAELRTDSMPGKVYKGWVGFISSTAEFTPKTVETTELRTKLVYRARVFVCDSQQELRLGMPVTVTVPLTPSTAPSSTPCGEGR